MTGLIKAVLSLEKKTIPPNIKFLKPNPKSMHLPNDAGLSLSMLTLKVPFAEKKLTVPREPTPWPADRAERISINSFGIGGTNAHVSQSQNLSQHYLG